MKIALVYSSSTLSLLIQFQSYLPSFCFWLRLIITFTVRLIQPFIDSFSRLDAVIYSRCSKCLIAVEEVEYSYQCIRQSIFNHLNDWLQSRRYDTCLKFLIFNIVRYSEIGSSLSYLFICFFLTFNDIVAFIVFNYKVSINLWKKYGTYTFCLFLIDRTCRINVKIFLDNPKVYNKLEQYRAVEHCKSH